MQLPNNHIFTFFPGFFVWKLLGYVAQYVIIERKGKAWEKCYKKKWKNKVKSLFGSDMHTHTWKTGDKVKIEL